LVHAPTLARPAGRGLGKPTAKRCFPDRAAAYFRATGLSAAEIAVAFGVDARTAKNWLEGIVAPRGDKVAVIALRDPEGFRKHFGEVAA
jgi:hypothetical protein